jgi:hypothetical protein
VHRAAAAGEGGRRHLLQDDATWFIRTNTNQSVAITDTNYQGGKAIIHVRIRHWWPSNLIGLSAH